MYLHKMQYSFVIIYTKGKIKMAEQKMYELGATIRQLRLQHKMTQKRLANLLGVTDANVSRYENNIAVPPLETLRTLAATFDVSMDTLCGLEKGNTLYLQGLTIEQEATVRELTEAFRTKNVTVGKNSPEGQYALIGRITEQLTKK